MATKRDGFIDFSKGFLILWVIHIHTVYFSGWGYISDNVRQISLFIDVPIFFFISGYLTKPIGLSSSIQRSARQFKNLYFNYLLLSFCLLIPLCLFYFIKNNSTPDLAQAIISMLMVNQTGEIWGDLPALEGSLWYIAVYLSLLPIIPFVINLCDSQKLRVLVLSTLLLLYAVFKYSGFNFNFLFTESVYVFFYLFVFLLGVSYKLDERKIQIKTLTISFLINIFVCLVVFFKLDNGEFILRSHKFPPSFEYLAYSLMLIHILLLVKKTWKYSEIASTNKICQFLEWCGRNVYFIYLFQGVACSLSGPLISLLHDRVSVVVLYFIALAFHILSTLILVLIYLKIRKLYVSFTSTRISKSQNYSEVGK